MPTPQAVEEAGRIADELYAKAYGSGDKAEGTQQSTPEAGAQQQTGTSQSTAQPDDETWEHKYKVLTGKYNAEVPRLAAERRELKDKLGDVTARLEQALQRIEVLEKSGGPKESLVKKEEVEEFGEPLVDLIRRAAREELSSKDREIAELRTKVDAVVSGNTKTNQEMFFDRLKEIVPDWETINAHEDFHRFLAEVDPLAGVERQDLLASAQRDLDATRVARFFTTWKNGNETRAASSQRSLEAQLVPDGKQSAQPPRGKRVFTRNEVAQFYADARSGKFSDDVYIAKEAEIMAALTDGRIR
jgi:hypothetical protein